MASKSSTPAETRRRVVKIARQIAKDSGTTVSPAAIKRLLAPSQAFFKTNPSVKITDALLVRELAPLVTDAIRQSTPAPKKVIVRGQVFVENPRPKPNPVSARAIATAMKRATCHFLWFC